MGSSHEAEQIQFYYSNVIVFVETVLFQESGGLTLWNEGIDV